MQVSESQKPGGRVPKRDDTWLNGWPRLHTSVLMGTSMYCAGCGRFEGVITVAIPDNWQAPSRDPDWPFPEEDCPVHGSPRLENPALNALLEIAKFRPQHWCPRRAQRALTELE